jgi:cyclohexanone monooxygenase
LATGCLSTANVPDIPGRDDFDGPIYHTGRWPHEDVDFTGQRVGVIGTGSSGIQSIPLIAERAAELTVFQRTANYTMPARNRPLGAQEVRERKAGYAELREEARNSRSAYIRPVPVRGALTVTAQERDAAYQTAWDSGVLAALTTTFDDIVIDREANETVAEFVRAKVRSIVADPRVAELLCARDYPIGTKRPCLDTNYYATYNEPHVRLVDLRQTPIETITDRGIRTSEREYDLDGIVFATGFDAMTGSIAAIDIRGKRGQSLREKWAAGPRNYLGLMSAGFPNLFTVTGPFSPSVLTNMIAAIEHHVDWITECVVYMRDHGRTEIDAGVAAEDAWTDHVAELAQDTLYLEGGSWYMGGNVPHKPRVFMVYLGGFPAYLEKTAEVAARGYEGFQLASEATVVDASAGAGLTPVFERISD